MISVVALIMMTISTSTPLIFAALGGVVSEKSGVTNIGIEGMILMGAFAGMVGSHFSGSPWIGIVFAIIAGGILASIHAFIAITCGGPQAVSATGLVLFATGFTSFGLRMIFNRAGSSDIVSYLPNSPIFKGIPVVGDILAKFSPFVYIALLCVVVATYIFYKTPLGLRINAVGENPKVAETLGIDVWKIRWGCVVVSGMLAGLGGAYLSIGQMNLFQENMSAGRGFLAMAAVILGRWKPQGAFLAALFFGFFEALQLQIQMLPNVLISPILIQAIPYVMCLLVLLFSGNKAKGPASNGVPYLKRH